MIVAVPPLLRYLLYYLAIGFVLFFGIFQGETFIYQGF